MLNVMREHVQSYVIKGILFVVIGAFIGTIFLVWGMGGEKPDTKIVGHIYQTPIYLQEYDRSLQNLINFYRRIYRDLSNDEITKKFDLQQKAIDELIQHRLLLHEAEEIGLKISKEELISRIKSVSYFQDKGVFNPLLYKQILKANHLTPSEYESRLRQEILLGKVEALIKDRVKVSEKEIRDYYVYNNEKITAEYVVFSPTLFKDKVSAKEEEIKNWFEEKKEDYKIPEKRTVTSLVIDPKDFHDKIQITDQEIEEYFQFNEKKYYKEPQVKASHILIKVVANAEPEEEEAAKKKIEDLRKQIIAGKDFHELAKSHSEDDATKEKGGDLGFFSKGRMVPAFEEVVFKLEPGELSEPVFTPYGVHLIKVTDKNEGGIPPLDELKSKIRKDMSKGKEEEMAYDLAEKVYSELQENPDMEAVAAKHSLRVKNFSPRTKEEIRNRREAEAVFALQAGQITDIITSGTRHTINKIELVEPEQVPEFDTVKDKAKKDLLKKKSSEVAEQEARAALKKLRDGSQTFAELVKTFQTPVAKSVFRDDEIVSKLVKEKIIEKIKDNPDHFYFHENIDGESQLLERLDKIGIDKKNHISAAWKRSYTLEVKEAKDFNRRGYIPGLSKLDDPIYPLFDLKIKDYSEPLHRKDDVVIFQIKEKKEIDEDKLEKEKQQITRSLMFSKKEDVFNMWLTNRKMQTEIQINQKLLN